LRLREAWRLSKAPYVEMTYRSLMMTRGNRGSITSSRSPEAVVKSVRRSSMVSKLIFTGVIIFGVAISFYRYEAAPSPATLLGAVSISLAISLAYMVVYSLQVLPSFSSAEPFSVLSSLPLGASDLSLVTLMSIVRTFDLVAVASVAVEVGAVAYLTASVAATGVMLFASVANLAFGVAASLWLSSLFYRNANRGGRGARAAIGRVLFLVTWGIAVLSISFLFSVASYALPFVVSAVGGALSASGAPILLALVHPFNAGMVVAAAVYPSSFGASSALGLASVLSIVVFVGYLLLAVFAGRLTLRFAYAVARGPVASVAHRRVTEFLLKIRGPVAAYIVKDVRVSTKSPSTAFIYAMPLFMAVVVRESFNGSGVPGEFAVVFATLLGCFFTMFSASVLLNTEGSGMDYTLSLPLTARVMVLAKSSIATASYLPVPLVIAVLLALGGPTSVWVYLVPFVEIAAVSAATSAELSFFIQSYKESGQTSGRIQTGRMSLMSGGNIVRLAVAFIVGSALVAMPVVVYAIGYFGGLSDPASLATMTLVAGVEFIGVQAYLRGR
jgi:Membrane protein of 12 TMs